MSIKDLIKQAQSGSMPTRPMAKSDPPLMETKTIIENVPTERNEHAKEKKAKQKSMPKQGFVERIKSINKGAEPFEQSLHIRLKRSTHQKMLIAGIGGLKLQELAAYAIDQLMESKEMVELIKNIKNDMD